MRRKTICISAAAILLAACLAGCGGEEQGRASSDPSVRPSAALPASHSPEVNVPNDAMDGGGAGGTNDTDNDGRPDASPDPSERVSGDGPLQDIGNAAGDLIQGAGEAVEDAGDAVGKAADRAGRAMK